MNIWERKSSWPNLAFFPISVLKLWKRAVFLSRARAVARLVLMDWDQQFLRLSRTNNIEYHLYKRYVDDTANGTEGLRCGIRWSEEEQRMILHPHLVEEDEEMAGDIKTAREVAKMGSSMQIITMAEQM